MKKLITWWKTIYAGKLNRFIQKAHFTNGEVCIGYGLAGCGCLCIQ